MSSTIFHICDADFIDFDADYHFELHEDEHPNYSRKKGLDIINSDSYNDNYTSYTKHDVIYTWETFFGCGDFDVINNKSGNKVGNITCDCGNLCLVRDDVIDLIAQNPEFSRFAIKQKGFTFSYSKEDDLKILKDPSEGCPIIDDYLTCTKNEYSWNNWIENGESQTFSPVMERIFTAKMVLYIEYKNMETGQARTHSGSVDGKYP